MPGRAWEVSDRDEFCRDVEGRCAGGSANTSCDPELRRICGGAFPRGEEGFCGSDMLDFERVYMLNSERMYKVSRLRKRRR